MRLWSTASAAECSLHIYGGGRAVVAAECIHGTVLKNYGVCYTGTKMMCASMEHALLKAGCASMLVAAECVYGALLKKKVFWLQYVLLE